MNAEPTLHELRAFAHLTEDLHFSRAAGRLGVAQSSLSETIRRLEAKLGLVLFERSSRRVRLTGAGERLLPWAQAVLDDLAAACAVADGKDAEEPAALTVGIHSIGLGELTRVVFARFRSLYPRTPLILRELTGGARAFFEARLDVALVRCPLDEHLVVHEVAREPRGVLIPARDPRAEADEASILDFLDDPFVAVIPDTPAVRDHWLACEHRGGERPNVGGEAWNGIEVIHALVHLGLVTTSGRCIPRHFALPGVAYVETCDLAPTTLGVAVRPAETRPLVLAFVELVRATVADLADRVTDIEPCAELRASRRRPDRPGRVPAVAGRAAHAGGRRHRPRPRSRGARGAGTPPAPAPGRSSPGPAPVAGREAEDAPLTGRV